MIERVVENWLTKVNERQYQFPFCQLLISKGFRVLHLSSHGPQEQGKDVIAIDPTGRPVAFQLKTGNIDLAILRKIHAELIELVELPIQFPGISKEEHHQAVLVTNGMLNDVSRQTITTYNQGWAKRGFPELQLIVRDDLLRDFINLHGKFLPSQLTDLERLLRFYTRDGSAPLPRKDFAHFIFRNMPFGELSALLKSRPSRRKIKRVKPKPQEIERNLASTALLTSYCVTPFASKKNYWAVFEAWTIFCAYALAVTEVHDLADNYWKETFDLGFMAARTALGDLIGEALTRDNFLEGDLLVDSHVHRARMTIVMGLMALYHIILKVRKEVNPIDSEIRSFVEAHRRELHLWGESAMAYLLLLGFYLELTEGSRVAEELWGTLLRTIINHNKLREEGEENVALADPYLEIDDAIAHSMGLAREPEWEREAYDGQAYSLRTLVMMLARRWRRQLLAANWYGITGVKCIEMFPSPTWTMLLWRAPKGDLRIKPPNRPQAWAELVPEATNLDLSQIPQRLASRPDFLAALVTVYPHRIRADTIKAIEDALHRG